SSRRRHTRWPRDWSSDVCSSDLGTLIALAADEIVIDRHAALGPVDPQLGQYAARSLVEVAEMPGQHEDQTLLLADVGRKALRQRSEERRVGKECRARGARGQ